MKRWFIPITRILPLLHGQNTTLRRRLMLYLSSMILALAGFGLMFCVGSGIIFNVQDRIVENLVQRQVHMAREISEDLEQYSGYGLNLSRQAASVIEKHMTGNRFDIHEFNDRPEALVSLQQSLYGELNSTIRMGQSSGVFAILDATANTKIDSENCSRSGLYLRLTNVSSSMVLDPETILFRGSAQIAREHGLELHNRWNMEFDTSYVPGYNQLVEASDDPNRSYFWSDKRNLQNTWEDVIFLCVPMKGSTGQCYGICGIELSAVHFTMGYPAYDSPFGSMVTVFAPLEDGKLRIDQGMTGSTEGTWLEGQDVLAIKEYKDYHVYDSGEESYLGVQTVLNLPGEDGKEWVAAVLIPKENCDRLIRKSRGMMMLILAAGVALLLLFALYLSKKFVHPILQSIEDMKVNPLKSGPTGIAELEELRDILIQNAKNPAETELPPDVEELFGRFRLGVSLLTPGEFNIFSLYLEGHKIAEIPEMAFISMSTVKKHNRNIYEKLGISSYEELLLYVDLFRRMDRMDELCSQRPMDL